VRVELEENETPNLILYKYRWVVLFAYFLTSSSTGALQGSLSTNRNIIDKFHEELDRNDLIYAKYADLILYLPLNFASIWIIEKYGLRKCISIGSIIMIVGSVLRGTCMLTSVWFWFIGHVICAGSQAFLKNPVSKLASNWFGDKERGIATAIGLVSTPLGIFISQILILMIFDEKDKEDEDDGGNPVVESEYRFYKFIVIQSVMTICMATPALFLIKDKPKSPPSMVATKVRPVQTFREAFAGLISNNNYILIFLYF
jgi:sugar phosphate permease